MYKSTFIDDFVRAFRRYNNDKFLVTVFNLKKLMEKDYKAVELFLELLEKEGFVIRFEKGEDIIECADVECRNLSDGSVLTFKYQLQNLPSLIEFSSKTSLPVNVLIIMKIIAQIICRLKIIYKAMVLDLDDTLWKGTLSEVGIDRIKENMRSSEGAAFLSFMRFVKELAEGLGIFVAICSRNDSERVAEAIGELNEEFFPIKNQIDCIIANDNSKSENIALIAKQLSILPGAVVFVDDNQIARDEVKAKMPEVFVPDWNNHNELINMLICSCCFERAELSLSSQSRKRQYRLIQAERSKNSRPPLPVKVFEDPSHRNAIELFLKSNQFNFSQQNMNFCKEAKSLYFNIYRNNGEDLGTCAALSFTMTAESLTLLNWAMSCRFFEIGLEELILLYIKSLAADRKVYLSYKDSGLNQKVKDLMSKYPLLFANNKQKDMIELCYSTETEAILCNETNLRME